MISEAKEKALQKRFKELGINKSDLSEKFVRSSGKGGQKMNKTSSCVYIKHIPSGIEVKVGKERSQAMNRFFARRCLADMYEELILGRESKKQQQVMKIRRQKSKRIKRSKEKILKEKDEQPKKE